MAGGSPRYAAKKDQRIVDRHAPQCDKETRRRSRMVQKKIVRQGVVGRNKEEGTEKHRLYHCPSWRTVGNQVPEGLEKWESRE